MELILKGSLWIPYFKYKLALWRWRCSVSLSYRNLGFCDCLCKIYLIFYCWKFSL